MSEEIRLRVPASSDFFPMVRLVALGVASARGFTLDGLEDVRIAVHEMASALVGWRSQGDGGDAVVPRGTMSLQFQMTPDGIRVVGERSDAPTGPGLSALSVQILEVIVDSFEFSGHGFAMDKRLDRPEVLTSSIGES